MERYRPDQLSQVVGNSEVVERLRLLATYGNIPNMILSGPPGTGKTTSMMCLAKQLLSPHLKDIRDGILELNASDARGIDVVRGKIKHFAQKRTTLPPHVQKVVILDEADAMMTSAQQALRRSIDRYIGSTRFALACNNVSNIIDSIKSRCILVRFQRVPDTVMATRLQQIAAIEGMAKESLTDDAIKALLFTANGDLRLAVNNLQAVASANPIGTCILAEHVFKIADQPHPAAVSSILAACLRSDPIGACAEMQVLWKLGHSPIDIVNTMIRVCHTLPNTMVNDATRIFYVEQISKLHTRIADGLSSLLQLDALIALLATTPTTTPTTTTTGVLYK